jgi:hypothetical protein
MRSNYPDPQDKIKLNYIPEDYSSLSVDGGAINNEPYHEVLSLLKEQYGNTPENGFHQYGMIMIDPFPDRAQSTGPYEKPNDLLEVVPAILSTLTDQSRIKRREMLEAEDGKYFRGIIFPRKWITDDQGKIVKPEGTPIASASAMAFGGFLDINFRQHDFFLGRNNARTFFRYFFSFPCKYDPAEFEKREVHPIHQHWTKEMIDLFLITHEGENFLPIIPDLNMLLESPEQREKMRYNYTIKEKPSYDPENLFRLKDAITNRFKTMLDIIQKRDFKALKEKERKDRFDKLTATGKKRELKLEEEKKLGLERAQAWMNKYNKTGMLSKIGGWLLGPIKKAGIGWGKKIASKKLAEKTIHTLLKDLGERGLLKKID